MAEDPVQMEWVLQAVLLASFADGAPSGAEIKTLQALLAERPELTGGRDLRQLLLDSHRVIRESGAEALLDRIASGLSDRHYQELAYRLVSQVIAADGKTAAGEATLLRGLQERFGLSPMDVLRLLE